MFAAREAQKVPLECPSVVAFNALLMLQMFFRKSAHVFLTVYFTCSNFEGYTESADVLDKILPKIWCHLKSHATDVHFQF